MSGWQTIDTAPKGDWVLLWNKNGWQLGFYMTSEDRWHLEGWAEPPEHPPTHWQPLPEPPEPQS